MKVFKLFILILFPSILFSQNECKITYISNEGFLIEVDGKKVLVDALFDNINEDWCDSPSDKTVELMKESTYPFDSIDLIAITHKHRDHFNEKIVINHLLSNPKAMVVCPKQVGDLLFKHPSSKDFVDRVFSITPQLLKDSIITIANIPIRILRLEHSQTMIKETNTGEMINKHQNIENLGYVFDINGVKIFHCGDCNPLNEKEFSTFSVKDEEIDVAFLERLFYAYEKEDIIRNYINPKKIILMHINPNNRSLYINHLKQKKNIKIFETKMDSIIF